MTTTNYSSSSRRIIFQKKIMQNLKLITILLALLPSLLWAQTPATPPTTTTAPVKTPTPPAKAPATKPPTATTATTTKPPTTTASTKPATKRNPKSIGKFPTKKKKGFAALDPRVGLIYAPFIPGGVSNASFGALGVFGYFSVDVPQLNKLLSLKKLNLRLRPGIISGLMSFSAEDSQKTGSFTLIPVLVSLAIYYDLKKDIGGFLLSPSFRWSQGVIFSSNSISAKPSIISSLAPGQATTIAGSYIGYTTKFDIGVEAKQKSNPKLAYFMEFGMMLHFEQKSANFITMSIGLAYHFM